MSSLWRNSSLSQKWFILVIIERSKVIKRKKNIKVEKKILVKGLFEKD